MMYTEIYQPAQQAERTQNSRYTQNYPNAAEYFDPQRMRTNIGAIQDVMNAMRVTYPGKWGTIAADRMLGGIIPHFARQAQKIASTVHALPSSPHVVDRLIPANIARHTIEGYDQKPHASILDPHFQEETDIAIVGNLDIIPYLVLQDLIARGVDPGKLGFLVFDQHFDASKVMRFGVHEGNWISAVVRDGIGAVAVLGNAGDQAKQLKNGTFTELFTGVEMPIAGEEARQLVSNDPVLIDHLNMLQEHGNVLLDHMMMLNSARSTDTARIRKAVKGAMDHFKSHGVVDVVSFVDLDVLAMVDEPITATNYNLHDPAIRLGMAPLLLPNAFITRRVQSTRGKPTVSKAYVEEAESEVLRFMQEPMRIGGTIYHPPRAAGPGGMTVGQVVQAIGMIQSYAPENGMHYGVTVENRSVLGGITEVQGRDVQGKSLDAARTLYRSMVSTRA